MAIYSLGLNTTVTTTGAAAEDIIAGAGNNPALMECGLTLGAATASTYALARSTNSPAQTGTTALQGEDPSLPAAKTTAAVTWSIAPTFTYALRRIQLPATIGLGIIWTFPRGIRMLAAAANLMIWNLATNSANTNIHWVVDE